MRARRLPGKVPAFSRTRLRHLLNPSNSPAHFYDQRELTKEIGLGKIGNSSRQTQHSLPNMKTFFTIGSIASALYLGWHHHQVTEEKNAAEAQNAELTSQVEAAKLAQEANSRAAQPAASEPAPVAQPTPKQNWVAEKNRNWQSSLNRGAYDNQHAVNISSAPVYVVNQPTTTTSGFNAPPPVRVAPAIRPPSPVGGPMAVRAPRPVTEPSRIQTPPNSVRPPSAVSAPDRSHLPPTVQPPVSSRPSSGTPAAGAAN